MKKQTLKRIIATSLASALAVTAFAGCNNGTTTTSSVAQNASSATESKTTSEAPKYVLEDNGVKLNEPGQFPIVKEGEKEVRLSIFTNYHLDQCKELDASQNAATKWLEEKLNIKFDWDVVSNADRIAKLNLIFSDQKFPDIIMNSWWDAAAQYSYGKDGLIVPLNSYYEDKDAYYYDVLMKEVRDKKALSETQIQNFTMPDGNIYSLGYYQTAPYVNNTNRFWIYEPWLKATNMEMPKTTEEYYNVLKAFKEQDANGNGDKNDEIPLTGSLKSWNCNPLTFLMNSFIYYSTGNKKTVVDNGKVKLVYMQDEFKEGLKYLNKLESEGLLIEETWTQDGNALKSLTSQEVQKVGSTAGGFIPSFTQVTKNADDSWAKWKSIAPLKGPKDVQYAETSANLPPAKFHITEQCKYPRVAFRFGDALYEKEIAMNVTYGLKGEYWDYAKEGEKGLNGGQASFAILKNYTNNTETKLNAFWGPIGPTTIFPGWGEAKKIDGDPATDQDCVTYDATQAYIPLSATPDMLLPSLLFNEDDSKKVVDLEQAINGAFDSMYVDIITHGDVDNKWSAFQTEIKNLGVDELLSLYQKAYDERMKTIK